MSSSIQNYDELTGAREGDAVLGPPRWSASEAMGRDVDAIVRIEGSDVDVYDFAVSGFSVLSSRHAWSAGQTLKALVSLSGRVLYEGDVTVLDREAHGRDRERYEFRLEDGVFDPSRFRLLGATASLRRSLGRSPREIRDRVPAGFRAATGDIYHFLQARRAELDSFQDAYDEIRRSDPEAANEIVGEIYDHIAPDFSEMVRTASLAADPFRDDRAAWNAAKEYTEATITPLLMSAPMPWRSYKKPLGYPGDFRVMLYYYENEFVGPTLFDRIVHKLFVDHPLSNGVRTRSGYVVQLMRDRLSLYRGADAFRVMSLGAGPAREIAGLHRHPPAVRVDWTLMDQEREALGVALEDGAIALQNSRHPGTVRGLHLSFGQVLANPTGPWFEEQDFIFSTGLFDYLKPRRAQALVSALYDKLRPGGMLAVANARGPNDYYWSPEFVLDWPLIYRDRDAVRDLGRRLPEDAALRVTLEPGDAYHFLLVEKPGG